MTDYNPSIAALSLIIPWPEGLRPLRDSFRAEIFSIETKEERDSTPAAQMLDMLSDQALALDPKFLVCITEDGAHSFNVRGVQSYEDAEFLTNRSAERFKRRTRWEQNRHFLPGPAHCIPTQLSFEGFIGS